MLTLRTTWVSSRLLTWLTAFVVFEVFMLAASLVTNATVVELLGLVGFLVSMGVLLVAGHWRSEPRLAVPPSPLSLKRRTVPDIFLIVLLAVVLAVVSLVLVSPAPGPDGAAYVRYSEELLKSGIPTDPYYDHFTFGYPGVIALTRLVYDKALGLALFQHALRTLAAVVVYWMLRRTNRALALACGIAVAASLITALFANYAMTESVYGSLLVIVFALAYRVAQPEQTRRISGLALLLGVLLSTLAVIRPAGLMLGVPILMAVAIFSRSWQRPLVMAGGIAAGVVLISGINLLLGGGFRFGTEDDGGYYTFPYVYYGLHDPENGPLAAALDQIMAEDYCPFTMPHDKTEIKPGPTWPFTLQLNCVHEYRVRTGHNLGFMSIYIEAIRAQLAKYVQEIALEVRHFMTNGEWMRISPTYKEIVPRRNSPCGGAAGEAVLLDYFCGGAAGGDLGADGLMLEVQISQPYRLQSNHAALRFWAALALLGFAFLESGRLRSLVALAALIILYHAGITAFAQFTIQRYVFVLTPIFFTITLTTVFIVVCEAIGVLRERRIGMTGDALPKAASSER